MITAYTSRRMKRSRVSVSRDSSPRLTAAASLRPRCASARSSRNAAMNATTIEITAVIHGPLDSQNVLARSSDMGREVRQPAVLLVAMGTLLRLEDPAPRLRAALVARIGVDVGAAAAAAAIRAEIGYYRAHLHRGRDAESLGELRAYCAEAMRPALPPEAAGVPGDLLTAALLDALAFSPYPDAAPALRALRAAGCALVVVSNWDYSLHDRLEQTGLAPLVDAAVASAELGAAKPDRAIFERALELAGAAPERAWHAGDSVREDVEGARAARIRAVLVARDEPPPARDRPGGADRERSGGGGRLSSGGGDRVPSGGGGRLPSSGGADRASSSGEDHSSSGGGDRVPSGGRGRRLPEGVPVLASLEGLPELVVSGGP